MVVTLFGGPNLLCKMLPVRNLDAKFLFDQTNLILNAIKKAGGNVVAIISPRNSQRQSAIAAEIAAEVFIVDGKMLPPTLFNIFFNAIFNFRPYYKMLKG